jgi:hypothetical protein
LRHRRQDRHAAGTDPERSAVPNPKRQGSDRKAAFAPVEADRVRSIAHHEIDRLLGLLRQTIQGGADVARDREPLSRGRRPHEKADAEIVASWITAELRREEIEVTKQLSSAGVTVVDVKPNDIQDVTKLMAPYWDDWAKQRGADAGTALAKVRTALGH